MAISSIQQDEQNDAANAGSLTEDDAANAFLKGWDAQDEPSDADEDEGAEAPEDGDEETVAAEDDDEGAGEEDGEQEDGDKDDSGDDAAEVEVTVDGEKRKVPLKDLKRLYGQEASLTRKSQEVAEKRKAAEIEGSRVTAALGKLIEASKARYEPYAKIDWLVASKEMDNETFAQLRKDANDAYQDLKFLSGELDGHMTAVQDHYQERMKEAAGEAVKVLSNPETGIPGWSGELYRNLCSFAVEQGMTPSMVSTIVDPAALKLLNMAMLYQRGKTAAAAKKKTTVKSTPKKVLKTTEAANSKDVQGTRKGSALTRLKETGTTEDGANAFLERWRS